MLTPETVIVIALFILHDSTQTLADEAGMNRLYKISTTEFSVGVGMYVILLAPPIIAPIGLSVFQIWTLT